MMTCLVLEGFFDEEFEFDLSLGRGCSLFFHEDDQTRQYHYFSTTIACGFRLFLRYVRSRTASQWRWRWEVGGERRDEVHGDRLLPVAALGPKSPLRALRAQLCGIGQTYLWE